MLGKTVKDVITGFSGVVTGTCHYLTGCNQALVQPRVKDDGAFVDSHWFDLDRLTVVAEVEPVQLAIANAGFDKPAPRR